MTSAQLKFAGYDFSNSGYIIIFQSFLFPVYLGTVAGMPDGNEPVVWAWLVAASTIMSVLSAPFIGRLGDLTGKGSVFAALVVGAAALSAMAFVIGRQSLLFLAVFFLAFNTFFELSQSIYDSFLLDHHHDEPKALMSLSSFAWGFGYLGGALFVLLYLGLDRMGLPIRFQLLVFALLYMVLSIPSIRHFARIAPKRLAQDRTPNWSQITKVRRPVPWIQLFIYWVIADSVASVMYFVPLYLGTELEFSTSLIGGLVLGGQLIAFPLTIMMGRTANKRGAVKVLRLCLMIWIGSLLGLFWAYTVVHVLIIMLGLALVMGSTQAIMRAHFATGISLDESGEGLGFYAIAQKSASIVAPMIVAGALTLGDSMRPAFLILALLISLAWLLSPKLETSKYERR